MASWTESDIVCNCKERMHAVTDKNGDLIAYHCKICGQRFTSEKEKERMRQRQLAVTDNEMGKQERIRKRLQFNEAVSPYRASRAKWVKRGFRRRLKIKKLVLLAGIAFVVTALILLLTGGW